MILNISKQVLDQESLIFCKKCTEENEAVKRHCNLCEAESRCGNEWKFHVVEVARFYHIVGICDLGMCEDHQLREALPIHEAKRRD
ncbi:hypothetical protein L6164_020031 [Bauhinia variegata]|uniref:Uncharacterized protein n=1 Tax=Bauhinia variegata TaxID=167791 RepID=A0ACB9MU84_BAUVA|nr:hypothetical protein L6164_020031 [Bauhinia variegata]